MDKRATLMDRAKKAYKRYLTFAARAANPKFFAPIMLCERDRAKLEVARLTAQIVRECPGEWTREEQELLRPL